MSKKILVMSTLVAAVMTFSAQAALAVDVTSADVAPVIVACNDHAHKVHGHDHQDLVDACGSAINAATKTTTTFTAEQVAPVIKACDDNKHGRPSHEHTKLTTACAAAVNKVAND